MRKPENIKYGLDDHPPPHISLALALQQLSFLAVYLVVSPFFARNLHLDGQQTLKLISATLLASALGVVLQTLGRFGIGSGLFCPLQATASTFGALTIAHSVGGIAGVFGAVALVGLFQMLFAFVFARLRGTFNLQIAGVSVLLIGMGLGHSGLKLILSAINSSDDWRIPWRVGLATLGLMTACNVWFRGYIHLFSAFIGLAAGFSVSALGNGISDESWTLLAEAPWFYLPEPMFGGWQVDFESLPAIVITGLFLSLHAFGGLVAAQRFNDEDWRRPEMTQIRRGIVAEGLTNVLGSLLNAVPITSSGGAVSMAAATGCTSRYMAYWLAILMILFAFMPKVIVFWQVLPDEVLGAAMMFLGCFTMMAGFQIVTSSLLDNRKILAIGGGILAGTSYEPLRETLGDHTPLLLQPALYSGLSLGIFVAVLLTLLFRLGSTCRERRRFDTSHLAFPELSDFLERQGKSWGSRRELVQRAVFATSQAMELLTEYELLQSSDEGKTIVEVETLSSELSFIVVIRYDGVSVPLSTTPPSADDLIENPNGVLMMAGYLIHQVADEIITQSNHEKPPGKGLGGRGKPSSFGRNRAYNAELRLVFNR